MDFPKTKLEQFVKQNAIIPHYDNEADLLFADSIVHKVWPYGIDINGTLILDFDKNHVLSSIELIVAKRYWNVVDQLEKPSSSPYACLSIAEESLKKKSFDLPLKVTTNRSRDLVCVTFVNLLNQPISVKLSDRCIAYLYKEKLLGFFFDIG